MEWVTITAATANGINVLNPTSKTIDIGLRTTGVTAGSYGGSTQIPSLVIDAFGRITSVANNTVSTTISLAGGSGSGSVSGGGTLTLSGGTGVTIGLSSSNSGISYKLYRGATLVTTVTGTGSANHSSHYKGATSQYFGTTSVAEAKNFYPASPPE